MDSGSSKSLLKDSINEGSLFSKLQIQAAVGFRFEKF